MLKDKVINEAKYIIENEATIESAANFFNCSISTIKKDIAKLKNSEVPHEKRLYEILKLQLIKNEIVGRAKGIATPHIRRKRNLSKEKIKQLAIYIIANNLTLESASTVFNIPKNTIYEAITCDLDDEPELQSDLQTLFTYHKKMATKKISDNSLDTKVIQRLMQKYTLITDALNEETDNNYEQKK